MLVSNPVLQLAETAKFKRQKFLMLTSEDFLKPDNEVEFEDEQCSEQNEQSVKELFLAIRENNPDKCVELIKAGSEVNACHKSKTALSYAAHKGHLEVIEALINAGADVNQPDKTGKTPLFYALLDENYGLMEVLISKGADVDWRQKPPCYGGFTCLHLASQRNLIEGVRLLIQAHCDVNVQSGDFPLHIACQKCNLEIVDQLVEAGADANLQNLALRLTPLHVAVTTNTPCTQQIVRRLLPVSLPDIQGFRGETAVYLATKVGNAEVLKLLLQAGWDPSIPDRKGVTPLMLAALSVNLELVEILTNAGASINDLSANVAGEGILHMLCHQECHPKALKALQLLLQSPSCDVNLISRVPGETPLHKAAKCGCPDLVALLIEQGADLHLKDSHGRTALVTSIQEGHGKVVELLANAGASLTVKETLDDGYARYMETIFLQSELGALVVEQSTTPLSLLHACRHVVRRNIRRAFKARVLQLPLPVKLLDFVLYGHR